MLVLSGYALGLFLAAQVGPVTLLIVRSVLRGGRVVAVGLAMAAAVATIDLAYAIVGLAGVGRLLNGGSVAATALNPLTIALWTVSFPAAAPAHAASSTAAATAVLAGVGLGTLTWYGGFSTAVALVRKRLGARLLALVDLASGCALIGFGSLLGYRTLREHA